MRRLAPSGSVTGGSHLKKSPAPERASGVPGRKWLPAGAHGAPPLGAVRQDPAAVHRYARDQLSAISAVTVSSVRQRRGLYCHCHFNNLTQFEVAACLRRRLRQRRGPILLLWDGRPIHRGPAVTQVLARHPRLQLERFPAYALELNPDEQVCNHFKPQLANGCPLSLEQLLDDLSRRARRARRSAQLLRSFVRASGLPPVLSPLVSITYATPNNLRAGRKAKASSAFASPCVYLATGMALLDEGDWGSQHDLMFSLQLERGECEFLSGNFENAEQLIRELLQRGPSKVDQAAAYHLKVQLDVARGDNPQALATALTCLNLFGIDLPAHPTWEQVRAEYEMVWRNLEGRTIEGLIDLPLISDPERQAAMRLLSDLVTPAYLTDFHFFCFVLRKNYQHACKRAKLRPI